MEGCFIVYPNPAEDFDIKCDLKSKDITVPDDQQNLYEEVEYVCTIIKSLHNTHDSIKRKYFNKLLSLARAGLVGIEGNCETTLTFKSLKKLKEEMIIIEGQRIKNEYMKLFGKNIFILTISILIGYLIFISIFNLNNIISNYLVMYSITFVCSLVGTWISFGARNLNISFKQLSVVEDDMMNQWIRLVYIGICSVILITFLNTDIIKINIGTISSSNIKESFEIQASIGFICGLIESKLGLNIYKKVENIIE